jgi:hypothetical protein
MPKKLRPDEISLDPGTIYFIGERDLITGEETHYVKIGLTKLDRTAEDREDNLKTGNPRELFIKHKEFVPLVRSVESALRFEFRLQNVHLEWHVFRPDSPKKLPEAIAKCQELGREFAGYVPIVEAAKALLDIESMGEPIEKTPDAEHWWREYLIHSHIMKLDEEARKRFSAMAQKRVGEGMPAPTGTTVRPVSRTVVDWKGIELDHIGICAEFQTTKLIRKFDVKGKLSPSDLQVPFVLDVQSRVNLFDALLKSPSDDEDLYYSDLFRQFLMIEEIAGFSKFKKELARCQLSVLCGDAPGIQGLLVWQTKRESTLDKEAIKSAHPLLVEKYTTTKVIERTTTGVAGEMAADTEE